MKKPGVVYFGSVNVELTTKHSNDAFTDLVESSLKYENIEIGVAGTAFNFSMFSKEYVNMVKMISRIGNDHIGKYLTTQLKSTKIPFYMQVDDANPTGLSIYIRDNSISEVKGKRLLIVDSRTAFNDFRFDESIEALLRDLNYYYFIFDGYSLLAPKLRIDLLQLVKTFKNSYGNKKLVFDILPHDSFEYHSKETLFQIIENVDIVNSCAATIWQYIFKKKLQPSQITKKMCSILLNELTRHFEGQYFILSFGDGGINEILIGRKGFKSIYDQTGYSSVKETKGFGDRLLSKYLFKIYENGLLTKV